MKRGMFQAPFSRVVNKNSVREQDLHRQVSLLKEQLSHLRVSNESTEARLLDQSQRLGKASYCFNLLT